jgi:hypothetical protein
MEEGVTSLLPRSVKEIGPALVQKTYEEGFAHIKSRASYIWELEKSSPDCWAVSTWSKMTKRSAIEKAGTASDKKRLPEATMRNRSHQEYTRRTKARKIEMDDDAAAAATTTKKNGNVDEEQEKEEEPDPPNVLSRDPNAVMYGVQPPDPSKSKPLQVVTKFEIYQLKQSGLMLRAETCQAFTHVLLSDPCNDYWGKGVRLASPNFYPHVRQFSLEHYLENEQRIYKYINDLKIENDLLVLIPIFTGHIDAGHFTSLILDRTHRDDGIFVFFDSYPGGSLAAEIEEFVKGHPRLWKTNSKFVRVTCRSVKDRTTMLHLMGVGKRAFEGPKLPTEMVTQALRSNDCGVFQSLTFFAYLRFLDRVHAWDSSKRGSLNDADSIKVSVHTNGAPGGLGKSGRRFIENALKSGNIDQGHSAVRFQLEVDNYKEVDAASKVALSNSNR